ncbi:hypothetical protein AXG93_903s1210 [Marchantia polymorpha subsp. ruderalis]|uniref:Uncharacterized protein n=1 Tax=Marchantia polymorpha subsp. ruderalis TaxID=1480154 RepID=A0A176VZC5_MARPO|nr:hypothetical protein AXG93_903s1210 [Marchantia polymorpha subsp. ruderalis]
MHLIFQDCNVDSDLYQITCNTTEDSQKTLTENPSEKLKVLAPPARVRDVREGPRSQSLAVTLVPRADSAKELHSEALGAHSRGSFPEALEGGAPGTLNQSQAASGERRAASERARD